VAADDQRAEFAGRRLAVGVEPPAGSETARCPHRASGCPRCTRLASPAARGGLLAHYVSLTVAPGGLGEPGPLRYEPSTHTLEHCLPRPAQPARSRRGSPTARQPHAHRHAPRCRTAEGRAPARRAQSGRAAWPRRRRPAAPAAHAPDHRRRPAAGTRLKTVATRPVMAHLCVSSDWQGASTPDGAECFYAATCGRDDAAGLSERVRSWTAFAQVTASSRWS